MPEIKPVPEHPFLSIHGWLTLAEGLELQRLASLPGFGEVVEIGSFKGRSTAFLATGCKINGNKKVHAIDHFHGSTEMQRYGKNPQGDFSSGKGSTFSVFQANMTKYGLEDFVVIHVGNSIDVETIWGGYISLLFIDGEHSIEGITSDYESWSDHVDPGGYICFHDYADPSWPEVAQFVDTLTFKKRTLIDSMLVCEL